MMSSTKTCSGCGYPYKLGEPYMGNMCDTGGHCNETSSGYTPLKCGHSGPDWNGEGDCIKCARDKVMNPTTPNTKQEMSKKLAWWLTKMQVETVKNHRPVLITPEDEAVLSKALEGIEQLLTDTVNKALDELESKKATYQDCDTGEHNWVDCTCDTEDAVSLSAIEQVRKRINDE